MNPRIIGAPQTYDPVSYTAALPYRFSRALECSRLVHTPYIYKISRLESCCNSWYDTDAEMLSNLWTEYVLVVRSLVPETSFPPITEPKKLRKQQLQEFETQIPKVELDTPLSMQLQRFGPVVRKFFLQGLGCAVPDIREEFYRDLQDLYPYLYTETLDLLGDWRTVSAFEYQLRSIPNFEL